MNQNGDTALITATKDGQPALVTQLLDKGSGINVAGKVRHCVNESYRGEYVGQKRGKRQGIGKD